MSIMSFLRSLVGTEEPTTYVEGTITESDTRADGPSANRIVAFRLDSSPDLTFQQQLSALAPDRHRGDRVRVHYRLVGSIADVQWVEKI